MYLLKFQNEDLFRSIKKQTYNLCAKTSGAAAGESVVDVGNCST